MGAVASQITGLTIVYSTVYSDADKRKHQSSASLAFVGQVNSPHKWPIMDTNVSIWWRHHVHSDELNVGMNLWYHVSTGMYFSEAIKLVHGSREPVATGHW